jgi:hypothetical protein
MILMLVRFQPFQRLIWCNLRGGVVDNSFLRLSVGKTLCGSRF